jgi:hypothetical protein
LLEINSGDHLGSSRTVSESMNICLWSAMLHF